MARVQIPAIALNNCVTLNKLPNLSVAQIPNWQNGSHGVVRIQPANTHKDFRVLPGMVGAV